MKKESYTPRRFEIDNNFYDAQLLKNTGTGKIHWHSHFLISVFKRGNGVQYLNNEKHNFSPGTAIFMGPFDFHYNTVDEPDTFDMYSIKFTHKIFDEHLYKICDLNCFPIVAHLPEKDFSHAQQLCNFLINEKSNPDSTGHERLVNNIIEQLVIIIIRNAEKKPSAPQVSMNISKALLYIHGNFTENLSVKDVAEIYHYTPNHFSFYFKKETGFTFQKYLHNLRLEHAFNLIKYGNKSCTEACYESGFNSMEYFSASFKKKFGNSPKFYLNS